LASGEGSGAKKYPNRVISTARKININPAMAPLFFFNRRHDACQKVGELSFMKER
jgi:hypothetical protein